MAGNSNLNAAAKARKDEFYTQLTDIEKELRHYKKHFQGRTVLCNCDDPFESNFFKYFVLNFNRLGLKKLIATCYAGSPIANRQLSLFDVTGEEEQKNRPYKAVVTRVYDKTGDGGVDMLDVAELFRSGENQLTELEGDGDFRSPECLALLDEADIVVTNPPFSLFREYVATLVEHEKGFIVIGPRNSLHYKEIFPLIKANKMWLGYGFNNGDAFFSIPEKDSHEYAAGVYDPATGMVHFRNCVWLTNLDIHKRHEEMILVKRYSPEDYPDYYNYDGIDVSQVVNIPCDYAGMMGVPDTFLDQHNPEQFEIIGMATDVPKTMVHKVVGDEIQYIQDGVCIWSTPYTVAERKAGNSLRINENGLPGKLPYSRIIIRNKHPESPKEAAQNADR